MRINKLIPKSPEAVEEAEDIKLYDEVKSNEKKISFDEYLKIKSTRFTNQHFN